MPPQTDPTNAGSLLRVGGVTPLTSIDFPGRLAAVVFCQGCPWRCSYCHNPGLLDAGAPPAIAWADVLALLRARQGLLDGVVFSGGEPLLQTALPAAIAQVSALGFAVALHTGGMYPERLAAVLPRLDWVGLDIKGPWAHIDAITASRHSAQRVQQSLAALLDSGVACECRTTWSPQLFGEPDLLALAHDLAARGVRNWVVQPLRSPQQPTPALSASLQSACAPLFERFAVR